MNLFLYQRPKSNRILRKHAWKNLEMSLFLALLCRGLQCNVCFAEKVTRHSSVLLLCLVTFSAEQTLYRMYIFNQELCFSSKSLYRSRAGRCLQQSNTQLIVNLALFEGDFFMFSGANFFFLFFLKLILCNFSVRTLQHFQKKNCLHPKT